MRFLLVCGFVFGSFSASAINVEKIHADIAEFSYANNKGSATSRDLSIEVGEKFAPAGNIQKIQIERTGSVLKVVTDFFTLKWNNIPTWLQNAFTISAQNALLDLGFSPAHQIKVGGVKVNQETLGDAYLKDFTLKCGHSKDSRDVIEQLPHECIKDGVIKITKLDVPLNNKFWQEALEGQPEISDEDMQQVADDIELTLSKGDFELGLRTKFLVSARVKAYGNVEYNEKGKKATLRIDKIKYGILPVTTVVFKVLKKKLPADKFKVEQPYIYVTL